MWIISHPLVTSYFFVGGTLKLILFGTELYEF